MGAEFRKGRLRGGDGNETRRGSETEGYRLRETSDEGEQRYKG